MPLKDPQSRLVRCFQEKRTSEVELPCLAQKSHKTQIKQLKQTLIMSFTLNQAFGHHQQMDLADSWVNKKSLSLGENSLNFGDKIWSSMVKIKWHKNCQIFEFCIGIDLRLETSKTWFYKLPAAKLIKFEFLNKKKKQFSKILKKLQFNFF